MRSSDLDPSLPPQNQSHVIVHGIDPGKYTLHVCTLQWWATSLPRICTSEQRASLPSVVLFDTIDWRHEWDRGVQLFRSGYVATESQWIDRAVFERWAGIESVVHTRGAMMGMAASVGLQENIPSEPRTGLIGVSETESTNLNTRFRVMAPTEWRSISIAPRPFDARTRARTSERTLAQKLLDMMDGVGFPNCKHAINADHAAAMGIALARAGLNYMRWIPI